jgi:hypothetical protein
MEVVSFGALGWGTNLALFAAATGLVWSAAGRVKTTTRARSERLMAGARTGAA